jgi:hypothetical protein
MAADETGNYLFTPSGRKIRKLGPWPQVGQTGSIGLLQSPDSTVLVNDTGVLYLGPGIASLFFPVGSQYTPVGLPSVIAITGTNGNAAIYDCGMRLLVPEKYHIVAEKAPGILTLKLEDSIYFLNLAGKLLFGGRGFNGKNCMLLEGEVVLLQNETGKWGALDAAGRVIHPFIYNGLYGNNNQPILWNNTDTLRLDNTGTPMQQPSHAASLQARLAESRNWYTEVYATQQNLQPGLYIAPGKKLSDLGVRSKCYGFGVDDDYHFVFMITDTTGTQMAVIDTMGNQLIPFIPRPDVTVLSRYTVVALYNKGQSMLYRIKGNATERLNITLDAAHKDAIINRHKGNLGFTNSETVYCTAEGVGKAVILPHSRMPLLEPGIDSIKEVNGYLQVKKRTGWGLFNQGWLCPPVCDSIITEQSSGDKWLWKNGKTGVMVNRTQALIHPEYDHIFNPNTIEFNYFIAMKNGKYLLLDGKERLLAPAYDSIEVKDDPYRWSALRNLKAKRGGKKYLLSVNINGEIEEKETL